MKLKDMTQNLLFLLSFLAISHSLMATSKGISKTYKKEPLEEEVNKPARNEMMLRYKAEEMMIEGEGPRSTLKIEGEVERLLVNCPLCDQKFKVIHIEKQVESKGIDRDFCKHTFNKSAIDFDLWCCPSCGYTHFKNFFPLKVNEEFKTKYAKQLSLAFQERLRQNTGLNIDKLGITLDQEDIFTSIKFSQMQMVLPDLNLPYVLKADFHLRFAWSERMRLCQPINEPLLSNAIGVIIERLKLYENKHQLTKLIRSPEGMLGFLSNLKEDRAQNNIIEFLCTIYEAQQWDRLGHTAKARELFKEAMKKAPSEQSRKVPIFKLKVLENELFHIKEAIIAYKEALRINEDNLDLEHVPFLLGELQRRISLFPEANAWLTLALAQTKDDKSANSFHRWIQETLELLPQPIPTPVSDAEKILIAKTEIMIQNLKASQISDAPSETPPTYDQDTIETWLERVHKATVFYYKEFNLDPENVQELAELGLFKNDPRLEKEASRLFRLKVTKTEFNPLSRYEINSLISFSDKEGYYWPSLKEGELLKSRQL